MAIADFSNIKEGLFANIYSTVKEKVAGDAVLITRISGSRVYYETLRDIKRYENDPVRYDPAEEHFCPLKNVQYVWDTADEALSAQEVSASAYADIENFIKMRCEKARHDISQIFPVTKKKPKKK